MTNPMDLAKTLEGLSAAALEARAAYDVEPEPGIALACYLRTDAAFATALINAYRTGQLIVAQAGVRETCKYCGGDSLQWNGCCPRVQAGDVEAVARAMAPSVFLPFEGKLHGSPVNRANAQSWWLKNAEAAISAMPRLVAKDAEIAELKTRLADALLFVPDDYVYGMAIVYFANTPD